MDYIPTTHKFVAVLNKKVEPGKVMNALAHMAAGLVGKYPHLDKMRFSSYTDKDGGDHPSISENPFIVLKAKNSNQLRTLRNNLMAEGVEFVDFTSTMTVGTYAEQMDKTKETAEEDLEYWGVCMFGPTEELQPLTKKFSLWQ